MHEFRGATPVQRGDATNRSSISVANLGGPLGMVQDTIGANCSHSGPIGLLAQEVDPLRGRRGRSGRGRAGRSRRTPAAEQDLHFAGIGTDELAREPRDGELPAGRERRGNRTDVRRDDAAAAGGQIAGVFEDRDQIGPAAAADWFEVGRGFDDR